LTDGTAFESRPDTSFNEYALIGEAEQAHDDNGNLTDDGELAYDWDAFNRLVRVMDGAVSEYCRATRSLSDNHDG